MFAVVRIKEPCRKFRKGTITSERITLPSDGVFFVVSVEKSFGKIPWKKLEKCLGILRQDVLLEKGVSLPESTDITVFNPQIYPRLLLMNSAADYILSHRRDFAFSSLTVFDEMGIYAPYIENLITCLRSIKIVTDKAEAYEDVRCRLMENYGFSLLVTDKEKSDSDVIISHNCIVPVYYKGTVFTNEKKYLMNAKTFSGSEIILDDLFEKLRPHNVDRLLFAAALYEKCDASQLINLKYEDFDC